MYAHMGGEGSMQGDATKASEETEFRTRQMDSKKSKQIESFISDMSRVFNYLNATRGVWRDLPDEKKLVDLVKASARELHDQKLEGAVENFSKDLRENCLAAISAVGGFQNQNLKDMQRFLRDNGYFFSITQIKERVDVSVDDMKGYTFTQKGLGFSADYVFGRIDESKIRGYGNTGTKVDFLKDVVTNIKHLSGRADSFGSESVIVVRNDVYRLFTDRLEKAVSELEEDKREIVNNFDKLGNDELVKWAQGKRPDNPNVALAEVVLMKLAQGYIHGKTKEQFLKDGEGFVESHELGEKIIMLKQYGEEGFVRETKQIGGRRVELISGPPILSLSKESEFRGWEREMASDMLALAEHPSIAIIKQMDEYLTMTRKAPEDAERVNAFRRYYESSREIVERIVKYVEENGEKFPDVHKKGVLIIGELSDGQLSSIAKTMLEKEYREKGYVFDSSLVF